MVTGKKALMSLSGFSLIGCVDQFPILKKKRKTRDILVSLKYSLKKSYRV